MNAYPTIHYLAPLFYAPLSNTIVDIAGRGLDSFVRTASKIHAGVTYPINTPIFDSGLYLTSDTAQYVATWTPIASTLKSIAMQIKQTRPLGTNLITNGTIEANTTGWAGQATLTRDTATPLVGVGSLKVATVTGASQCYFLIHGATVGHLYFISGIVKTGAAGKMAHACDYSVGSGSSVDCGTTAQQLSHAYIATGTDLYAGFAMDSFVAGDSMLVDSAVCVDITAIFGSLLTVWTAPNNKLRIYLADNLIKWTDDTTTVQATFPTASYLAGTLTEIVVIEDTSHAVTIAVHKSAATWYSAT